MNTPKAVEIPTLSREQLKYLWDHDRGRFYQLVQLVKELRIRRARSNINDFITYVMRLEKTEPGEKLGRKLKQSPTHIAIQAFVDENPKAVIWGAVGLGKCVTRGTLFTLEGGREVDTIELMARVKALGPGKVRVWTIDTNTYEPVTVPVLAAYFNGKVEAVQVNTLAGLKANTSLNHPYWTLRNGKWLWCDAGEVRPAQGIGHEVLALAGPPPYPRPLSLPGQEAFDVGFILRLLTQQPDPTIRSEHAHVDVAAVELGEDFPGLRHGADLLITLTQLCDRHALHLEQVSDTRVLIFGLEQWLKKYGKVFAHKVRRSSQTTKVTRFRSQIQKRDAPAYTLKDHHLYDEPTCLAFFAGYYATMAEDSDVHAIGSAKAPPSDFYMQGRGGAYVKAIRWYRHIAELAGVRARYFRKRIYFESRQIIRAAELVAEFAPRLRKYFEGVAAQLRLDFETTKAADQAFMKATRTSKAGKLLKSWAPRDHKGVIVTPVVEVKKSRGQVLKKRPGDVRRQRAKLVNTYAVEIDDDRHTHLTGGILTHNTQQISVARSLFTLGNNLNARILLVMSKENLAKDTLTMIKTMILESEELKEVFPDLKPGDLWQAHSIRVVRTNRVLTPSIRAIGAETQIDGSRYDLIIVDDSLSFKNTSTKTERDNHFNWLISVPFSREEDWTRIIVIGNAWHCLAGHQLVITDGGKLVRADRLTADHKVMVGPGVFEHPSRVWASPGPGRIYKVKARGQGEPLSVTGKHVLMTADGEKRARDVTVGDHLVYERAPLVHSMEHFRLNAPDRLRAPSRRVPPDPAIPKVELEALIADNVAYTRIAKMYKVSPAYVCRLASSYGIATVRRDYQPKDSYHEEPAWWTVVGYWVAEGSSYGNCLVFSFGRSDSQREREAVTALMSAVEVSTGIKARRTTHINEHGNRCMTVKLSSSTCVKWMLRHVGKRAHLKTLDPKMEQVPEPYAANFFYGYFDGDGCRSRNGARATTVSRALVYGMQRWLANLGYAALVYRGRKPSARTAIGKQVVSKRRPYELRVPRMDAIRLGLPVGPAKRNGYPTSVRVERYRVLYPVTDVTVEEYSQPVYDLTTSTGWFYVPNAKVHNSNDAMHRLEKMTGAWKGRRFPARDPNTGLTLLPERWPQDRIERWEKSKPPAEVRRTLDCFPAGSLVLTRNGYTGIEKVRTGDEVLTHRGRWREVSATMCTRRRVVEVVGHGHPAMTVSGEHPFYVCERGKKLIRGTRNYAAVLDGPLWKKAAQLGRGDYWATPTLFPTEGIPEVPVYGGRALAIDESLMWLAGRYLADGWIGVRHGSQSIVITCGHHKTKKLRAKLNVWERSGVRAAANEIVWHERDTATAHQFITTFKGLAEWLAENFGKLAAHKKIPVWALGMSVKFRRALLDGYLAGDGYYDKRRGTAEASTVSKALAFGLKGVAVSLGYTVTVRVKAGGAGVIQGRAVATLQSWKLAWRATPSDDHKQTWHSRLYEWAPIRKVGKPSSEEVEVFNLSVKDDDSYVVEGIVVHNCTPFSNETSRFDSTWFDEALRRGIDILRDQAGNPVHFLTSYNLDTERLKTERLRTAAIERGVDSVEVLKMYPMPVQVSTGVDLGFGLSEDADYTVLMTAVFFDDGECMVINIDKGRWGSTDIIPKIVTTQRLYQSTIFVEAMFTQKWVYDNIHQKHPDLPIYPWRTDGKGTIGNKWDMLFGIESVAFDIGSNRWILPCVSLKNPVDDIKYEVHPNILQFKDACLLYVPDKAVHTADELMAAWIMLQGARLRGSHQYLTALSDIGSMYAELGQDELEHVEGESDESRWGREIQRDLDAYLTDAGLDKYWSNS